MLLLKADSLLYSQDLNLNAQRPNPSELLSQILSQCIKKICSSSHATVSWLTWGGEERGVAESRPDMWAILEDSSTGSHAKAGPNQSRVQTPAQPCQVIAYHHQPTRYSFDSVGKDREGNV